MPYGFREITPLYQGYDDPYGATWDTTFDAEKLVPTRRVQASHRTQKRFRGENGMNAFQGMIDMRSD
ncbi:hypothetical protein PoMZ_13214 [Pyricularia oryzae]|uniref:Uncharacterized protein n=1 Tax=Pyricularia oryzae TaxID=318829 RepID=A0A4P7NUS4_PYROR|nr:hypothetical protein PoMZ_13214 [Pyricularia oryzae]